MFDGFYFSSPYNQPDALSRQKKQDPRWSPVMVLLKWTELWETQNLKVLEQLSKGVNGVWYHYP
jgi:hypothetical protein